jgi:hypothetical protein
VEGDADKAFSTRCAKHRNCALRRPADGASRVLNRVLTHATSSPEAHDQSKLERSPEPIGR